MGCRAVARRKALAGDDKSRCIRAEVEELCHVLENIEMKGDWRAYELSNDVESK